MKSIFSVKPTKLTCLATALLAAGLTLGCSSEPEPEAESGINIQWPGGEVNVGGGNGVHVRAPGVEVNHGKDGTSVEAPNTDIKVQ